MGKQKWVRLARLAPGIVVAMCLVIVELPLFAEPPFKKAFVVVLENTNYERALEQPFLNSLARRGALLSNYSGVTHPSQGNYIALTSGDLHGVKGDSLYDINATNIVDLLEKKSKTWRLYADGYPGSCFSEKASGRYVRKHNPLISFTNIRGNPRRCANIVSSAQLQKDVETGDLQDFSLFVPDLDNDGHDTGVEFADRWMRRTFSGMLENPAFTKDLLFVVTFDESATYVGNHIYTVLLGDMVKPGIVLNGPLNHYSLLRTLEDAWGLGTLGRMDARARPIVGFLR